MKNVLLINGHEPYAFAEGKFNSSMLSAIENKLKGDYKITTTVIKDGYDIEEEQEKFKAADLIIFQFPIYWFSTPAMMKKYLDQVYAHGVFFGIGDEAQKYGYGNGMMNGKKYMFSITSNAPYEAFNDADGFFEGRDLEDFLFHMHKTNQFCGMEPLKSFGAFNVIKSPQVKNDIERLNKHMEDVVIKALSETQISNN
ncbi:NAD(P)H-dependent oxidoreductase [Carboxylicivirga sp. RSCT41]|uniref:NAD(P)H-dependent oxidoreductase n=1 Tax=Carboxylicivirga agarovorans TaxID=3417570 RepID=UPI003D3444C4